MTTGHYGRQTARARASRGLGRGGRGVPRKEDRETRGHAPRRDAARGVPACGPPLYISTLLPGNRFRSAASREKSGGARIALASGLTSQHRVHASSCESPSDQSVAAIQACPKGRARLDDGAGHPTPGEWARERCTDGCRLRHGRTLVPLPVTPPPTTWLSAPRVHAVQGVQPCSAMTLPQFFLLACNSSLFACLYSAV